GLNTGGATVVLNTAAAQLGSGATQVTLGNLGTLELAAGAGTSTQVANVNVNGAFGSNITVSNSTDVLVLSGVLSGSGNLTVGSGVASGGTLQLNNTGNTFQGHITVQGGTATPTATLDVGTSAALAQTTLRSSSVTLNNNGSRLQYTGPAAVVTLGQLDGAAA